MSYVKCKVVCLPTEKATGLFKLGTSLHHSVVLKPRKNNEGFYLYICSNEIIRKGDWYVRFGKIPVLCPDDRFSVDDTAIKNAKEANNFKIIATTDHHITIGSKPNALFYPRPSDSFIKKFCQLGNIDEVLVEYYESHDFSECSEEDKSSYPNRHLQGKLELKVAPDNTITIKPVIKDLIADLEEYLREERVKLRDEYEGCDYGRSLVLKSKIEGIDLSLQFISKNK